MLLLLVFPVLASKPDVAGNALGLLAGVFSDGLSQQLPEEFA